MFGKRFLKIYKRSWVPIAVLLGFCIIFYFPFMGRWDLKGPDEVRYTQIAREITEGGDWISLHLNGRPYWEKPPLFFWMIAFSSYLWEGFSSFSARFPSAFFGTLTVLLTFFMGKGLYGSWTGLFSALILATSLGFARFSTRAYLDIPLTFFTTASLFCFLQWYRRIREGSETRKGMEGLFLSGFYVSMALATLAKGPIGFLAPLMVSLVWLLIQKEFKLVKKMGLVQGMVLLVAIVLSWYLPAVLKQGEAYLRATLSHPTGYYLGGAEHVKPFYFYLGTFAADFLPWFFFLPGAMIYGKWNKPSGDRKEFSFLLTWFFLTFLFFSLSATKRGQYLLPLFPAASLIVGKLWGDLASNRVDRLRRYWVDLPLYGLLGLALAVAAIIYGVTSKRFPPYFPYTLLVTLLIVGSSIASFVFYRLKRYRISFFLLVGMSAVVFFYTESFLFYLDSQLRSGGFILRLLKAEIGL
ncbi:MAG: ArnT family glycosyltransferase [Thermodesulfobacteriota bacterium]